MNDSLLLAELLEEIYQRVEAGESVDIQLYTEKYPQLSSQLGQLIPAMAVLGEFSKSTAELHRAVQPAPSSRPTQLGDFRLVRQIGQGGMGVVYEAEQLSLSRRVAVKVLPFASLWPESVLERFRQEVRIAASLEHPHMLQIFGYGCENGVHFYSMKLVDGGSLADVIRQRKSLTSTPQFVPTITTQRVSEEPTPGQVDNTITTRRVSEEPTSGLVDDIITTRRVSEEPTSGLVDDIITTRRVSEEATPGLTDDIITTRRVSEEETLGLADASGYESCVRLALSAAEALAFAHERGVVHRDIKPSNLLLDSQGKLFVADFGLARGDTDINLTRTGELLGTPRYMSPEQATGSPRVLDARTDIYSLGATIYELITLQPVIRAVNRAAALRELHNLQVVPPRQLDANIPQPLEQIVLKCLQPDPQDRYRSADELSDDLRRFLDGRAVVASSPGLVRRASRYIHAHPRSALGMVAVLTLCLLIPGIFWFADGGHPSLTSRGPPQQSGLETSTATVQPLTKNSSLESPDMLRPSPTKNQNTQDRSTSQRRLLVEQLEDRKLLAVLAGDGFESANFNGGSGWVGAGWQVAGDATVLSSNGPHAGQYQARLRSSSGDLIRAVDVSGQTDLHLQFWSKVSSFESSDKAQVRVSSDGVSWNTVQQFGSAQSDNQYHFYDIAIANPSNTLYIRFDAGMSATSDQWYLDDIAVTGVPSVPQISISDASAIEGSEAVKFLDAFVTANSGRVLRPRGVEFNPDNGNLYVGHWNSRQASTVLEFNGVSGQFLGVFADGSSVADESSRVMFHKGKMYVATGRNGILRFDAATGSPIPAAGKNGALFVTPIDQGVLDGIHDFTFGPNDELYVTSNITNQVLEYDGQSGDFIGVFIQDGSGGMQRANAITIGSDGHVYVGSSGNNTVLRFQGPADQAPGTFIDTFVESGIGGISWISSGGLKFGPDGDLYVSSRDNSSVMRFDGISGDYIETVVASGAGGLNSTGGLTFDSQGRLYVASQQSNEVLRYGAASISAFTITLSRASADSVTVDYQTEYGTATSTDFDFVSGTITFAPGETSHTILVPTIDDSDLEGDETFYVNLTNAVGGVIVDAQGVGTIVDNEVPPQVDVSATSESNVYGSVAGSYLSMQAVDGIVETLTEERYSSNRRTRLEHRWRFDNVTSGDSVELLVTAAQTNSNPVETFSFSYSTDNANWTTLGNLGPSSYPLPNSLSGTVYVRVVDTNRSNNEKTLDVLAVDQLLIRTTTAPASLSSPLAPPPSSFATTSILDQSSTEEEQLRNPSWIAGPVLAAPTDKPLLAQSTLVLLPTTDSLPARSASSGSDASSVDEVFGDWGLDSSALLDSAKFGL